MAEPDIDPFLQEVLGLFAQEAQEWTTRSQAALRELGQAPPPPRRAELFDYLTAAMTNLGGSAATVELAHVERAAFGLLPLLDAMRKRPGGALSAQLETAQAAIRFIIGAISEAVGASAFVGGNGATHATGVDALLARLADATTAQPPVVAPPSAPAPAQPVHLEPAPLMDVLLEWQRSQPLDQGRRTIDALLKRLQAETGGVRGVEPAVVVRALAEFEEVDDRLLRGMRDAFPALVERLERLEASGGGTNGQAALYAELAPVIAALLDAARAADAPGLIRFFQGLQSFVTISSRGLVTIEASRFQAVLTHVQQLLPVAEAWVEAGRSERIALHSVLPH